MTEIWDLLDKEGRQTGRTMQKCVGDDRRFCDERRNQFAND